MVDVARSESIIVGDFESEKRQEIISILNIITSKLAMPLYMVFWLADLIYIPHLAFQFLPLRASVIPMALLLRLHVKKITTVGQAERAAVFATLIYSSIINLMIIIIGDPSTIYYAGLNLVALGTVSFVPWSMRRSLAVLGLIFGPYISFSIFKCWSVGGGWTGLFLNMFFVIGTSIISLMIRRFSNTLRAREFQHRHGLRLELDSRNRIVAQKTKETVELKELSRQFSPQIVHAISSGQILLTSGVHRANICAIFVDIVNSTQRIVRIDKDSINAVISCFMDDTLRILIKYDLTIDKFLGDGILAFANDPMPHPDYIERTLFAAFDILERIKQKQPFYEDHWLSEFQVKIGIAAGFANVGFYGKTEVFRSYTAIGPVVNLASRLCSEAKANSVIASNEVKRALADGPFKFNSLGPLKLKGFEQDLIKAHEVELVQKSDDVAMSSGIEECPNCKRVMHLDVDTKGIYVFRCRECNLSSPALSKTKAA
jgi:adenylate cyclase